MLVLDTDVLSALMQADSHIVGWIDGQPATTIWTTAITVMEIRFGLHIMADGRRKVERHAAFETAIAERMQGRVLGFDEAAAQETAFLMSSRQQAGRPRELRDSMIAGIVLAQRATLATRNIRHFDDLNANVVNPWQA